MEELFRKLQLSKNKQELTSNEVTSNATVSQSESLLGPSSTTREDTGKSPALAKILEQNTEVQVSFTSNCSTCCYLNVGNTPTDGRDNDWARREYKVAAGMPGRKLSIKHTQLLASSASGCIFCFVVCKSLSAIRPGWETEKSFIELFLAPSLPVVVRWINGGTSTMKPLWEETLGDYVEYEIKVKVAKTSDYIEPDIEFEIYRPELPQQLNSTGTSLFLSLDSYAQC